MRADSPKKTPAGSSCSALLLRSKKATRERCGEEKAPGRTAVRPHEPRRSEVVLEGQPLQLVSTFSPLTSQQPQDKVGVT